MEVGRQEAVAAVQVRDNSGLYQGRDGDRSQVVDLA